MMDLLKDLQQPWLIWVRMYIFFNASKITPEELFTNDYAEEVYES